MNVLSHGRVCLHCRCLLCVCVIISVWVHVFLFSGFGCRDYGLRVCVTNVAAMITVDMETRRKLFEWQRG